MGISAGQLPGGEATDAKKDVEEAQAFGDFG